MNRFTLEQRHQIVQIYFENQSSVRQTHRRLREFYGPHDRPSEQFIRRTVDKFHTTHSLHDVKTPIRQRNVRNERNIAAVRESVEENPKLSVRRRSQQVGLCPSTTWKILRKDLKQYPYKIQLVQELKPQDHELRLHFANWALAQLEIDPLFYRKILFSDEAHFWLSGFVNKQNCRIWCDVNPQEIEQTPLHSEKVTVWCGLHAGGIIGPYLFKNEAGDNVTVNGERYRTMINEYLFQNMDNIDTDEMWMQQDGATCHTANQTIALLQTRFGDKLISRNGPVNYPPRSCDVTPLDYFLWGYVKSLVFANKPATIEALEANIVHVIQDIRPEMLEKVTQNWTKRIRYLADSRGDHMPQIVFKC